MKNLLRQSNSPNNKKNRTKSILWTIWWLLLWLLVWQWANAQETLQAEQIDSSQTYNLVLNQNLNRIQLRKWINWNVNIRDIKNPSIVIWSLNKSNIENAYISQNPKSISHSINWKNYNLVEINVWWIIWYVASEFINVLNIESSQLQTTNHLDMSLYNFSSTNNFIWGLYWISWNNYNFNFEGWVQTFTFWEKWIDLSLLNQDLWKSNQEDNSWTILKTQEDIKTAWINWNQDLHISNYFSDKVWDRIDYSKSKIWNNEKKLDTEIIRLKVLQTANSNLNLILWIEEIQSHPFSNWISRSLNWVVQSYETNLDWIISTLKSEYPSADEDFLAECIIKSIYDKFMFYIKLYEIIKKSYIEHSLKSKHKEVFFRQIEGMFNEWLWSWSLSNFIKFIDWYLPNNSYKLTINSKVDQFTTPIDDLISLYWEKIENSLNFDQYLEKIYNLKFLTLQVAKRNNMHNIWILDETLENIISKYKSSLVELEKTIIWTNSILSLNLNSLSQQLNQIVKSVDAQFTIFRKIISWFEVCLLKYLNWVPNKNFYIQSISSQFFEKVRYWDLSGLIIFLNNSTQTQNIQPDANIDQILNKIEEFIEIETRLPRLESHINNLRNNYNTKILDIFQTLSRNWNLQISKAKLEEIFDKLWNNIIWEFNCWNFWDWLYKIWQSYWLNLIITKDLNLNNIDLIYSKMYENIYNKFKEQLELLKIEAEKNREISLSRNYSRNPANFERLTHFLKTQIYQKFDWLPVIYKEKAIQEIENLKSQIFIYWINIFQLIRMYQWNDLKYTLTTNIELTMIINTFIYIYASKIYREVVEDWRLDIENQINSWEIEKTSYSTAEINHIKKIRSSILELSRRYLRQNNSRSQEVYIQIESKIDYYIKLIEYLPKWSNLIKWLIESMANEYVIKTKTFSTYTWRANDIASIAHVIRTYFSRRYIESMNQQEFNAFQNEFWWRAKLDTFIDAKPYWFFSNEEISSQIPKFETNYWKAFDQFPPEKKAWIISFFSEDNNIQTARRNAIYILMILTWWESNFHQFTNNSQSSARWWLQHLVWFIKDFNSQPYNIELSWTAVLNFIYDQFILPNWYLNKYNKLSLDQRIKVFILAYYNWHWWAVDLIKNRHWWNIDKAFIESNYWSHIRSIANSLNNILNYNTYEQIFSRSFAQNKNDRELNIASLK